jgi:hydrogenase/urease accessory protein HupE
MNKSIKISPYALLLASLVALPPLARAHHAEFMTTEPFLQGISMPIHGLDHMLVTIAVGLIAAQLGGKALWAIPGIFSAGLGDANGCGDYRPLSNVNDFMINLIEKIGH